jgi:hypothetical protein
VGLAVADGHCRGPLNANDAVEMALRTEKQNKTLKNKTKHKKSIFSNKLYTLLKNMALKTENKTLND